MLSAAFLVNKKLKDKDWWVFALTWDLQIILVIMFTMPLSQKVIDERKQYEAAADLRPS